MTDGVLSGTINLIHSVSLKVKYNKTRQPSRHNMQIPETARLSSSHRISRL